MPYAVELYFDPATEAAVRGLWRTLGEAGIDDAQLALGFRPHVSLAVAEDVDRDALRAELGAWAARTDRLPITLASLGVFVGKGVVFLAPAPHRALLDAHADFHRTCGPALKDPQPYYAPDVWVPHVTLAQDVEAPRAGRALAATWDAALPLAGQVVEVGVSQLRPVLLRYVFQLRSEGEE